MILTQRIIDSDKSNKPGAPATLWGKRCRFPGSDGKLLVSYEAPFWLKAPSAAGWITELV